MAKTNCTLPSPDDLRKLLRYNPNTGVLYWRERPQHYFSSEGSCKSWNTRHAGNPAGSLKSTGYVVLSVNRRGLFAHRVAYAMYYGRWPKNDIDHRNGVCDDNRIVNLRDVSHSQNLKNSKMRTNNTSGVTGVYWNKSKNKWGAYLNHGGAMRYLGLFDCLEDAAEARRKAEKNLGFTSRHGKA